jgi:hypothetical protein
MSSDLDVTRLRHVVNPAVAHAHPLGGAPAANGTASSVPLVIMGSGVESTGRAAINSGADTFEVESLTLSEITELSADAFPGTRVGVRANASSLAEGQVVAAVQNGVWFGAAKLGPLQVDSENSAYLVGKALDTIGSNMESTEVDVHVFAFLARPLLSIVNPLTLADQFKLQITTDGVHQGIIVGEPIVIELNGGFFVATAATVTVTSTDVEGFPIPTTVVILDGVPLFYSQLYALGKQSLKLWFGPVVSARLVKIPPSEVSFAQIAAAAASATEPGALVLDSLGKVITAGETAAVPPIRILQNLSLATRGETVTNEILGSGNAATPFQSFRLKKSPLTYLADPTAPNGRRSTLEVHVDGQKWREAQTFYGALPTDPIYVIRHDEDHQTEVVFGDGELGRRLPTGVNNVVATYRFGVGGNVPANSINTLKKPIKGVRKVFNPLPATGGKEPPTPEQVRREAPLGMLVLGRLVSLPDFEAETRRYGNVVNAKARWGWDQAGEDASVQVWFATRDEGDPSIDLRKYLEGLAAPNTQVSVSKAEALSKRLTIDLVVDPRYKAEDVELEVAQRLFDDWDGVLSVRNMPIGGRLHRSRLYAVIHAVPGVLGIDAISIDGDAMDASRAVDEGTYLDFENVDLMVGGTEAGKRLFGAN